MSGRPLSSRHAPIFISKRANQNPANRRITKRDWDNFWSLYQITYLANTSPEDKMALEVGFDAYGSSLKDVVYDMFRTYFVGKSVAQIQEDAPLIDNYFITIGKRIVSALKRNVLQNRVKAAGNKLGELVDIIKEARGPRGGWVDVPEGVVGRTIFNQIDDLFRRISERALMFGASTAAAETALTLAHSALGRRGVIKEAQQKFKNLLANYSAEALEGRLNNLGFFNLFATPTDASLRKLIKSSMGKTLKREQQEVLLGGLHNLKREFVDGIMETADKLPAQSLVGAKTLQQMDDATEKVFQDAYNRLELLDEHFAERAAKHEVEAPQVRREEEAARIEHEKALREEEMGRLQHERAIREEELAQSPRQQELEEARLRRQEELEQRQHEVAMEKELNDLMISQNRVKLTEQQAEKIALDVLKEKRARFWQTFKIWGIGVLISAAALSVTGGGIYLATRGNDDEETQAVAQEKARELELPVEGERSDRETSSLARSRPKQLSLEDQKNLQIAEDNIRNNRVTAIRAIHKLSDAGLAEALKNSKLKRYVERELERRKK